MRCETKALTSWYLYLLQSKTTGKIYTGISPDPQARLEKHNAGKGAKATRVGRPWYIAYLELVGTKGDALRRELQIKKMKKVQKLDLINSLD